MGFDQPDSRWRDGCLLIGILECSLLSIDGRSIDGRSLTVTGSTDGKESGIDPVAISHCIIEPFQDDDSDTLSQYGPVTLPIEGSSIAGGGQGWGLGEAHVHEDVVEGVDSTGDHHVASTTVQFQRCQVESGQ